MFTDPNRGNAAWDIEPFSGAYKIEWDTLAVACNVDATAGE